MSPKIIHNQKLSQCLRKQRLWHSCRDPFELPLGGRKTQSLALPFRGVRQPNLTEKAKPVPLKITNTHFMGKLRQGVMAVAAGLALAGCSEANAEDNTQAEIQKVAAVVETTKVTRDQCIALATKAEKIKCMKTLKAQRVAEIAALDTGLVDDTAEIAAKTEQRMQNAETIADTKTERAKVKQETDVLSKEIDQIYVEAAKAGGGS